MSYIIRESGEYTQDSNSYERIQREKDYISYLTNHISNVKAAYQKYFVPLLTKDFNCNKSLFNKEQLRKAIEIVKNDVDHHDESKWSEIEFEPYRMHWNPTEEEKQRDQRYQDEVQDAYMNAWQHHYENNNHHPKFWYDFENNIARDMSLDAIIHMLCDWISFNLDSPSGTVEWWIKNASEERRFISPNTINILEDILFNILFPEDYKKFKPVTSPNINAILKNSENK